MARVAVVRVAVAVGDDDVLGPCPAVTVVPVLLDPAAAADGPLVVADDLGDLPAGGGHQALQVLELQLVAVDSSQCVGVEVVLAAPGVERAVALPAQQSVGLPDVKSQKGHQDSRTDDILIHFCVFVNF